MLPGCFGLSQMRESFVRHSLLLEIEGRYCYELETGMLRVLLETPYPAGTEA